MIRVGAPTPTPGGEHGPDRDAILLKGGDEETIALLARLRVSPSALTGPLREANGFLAAAVEQGLRADTVEQLLHEAHGDVRRAWTTWVAEEEDDELDEW